MAAARLQKYQSRTDPRAPSLTAGSIIIIIIGFFNSALILFFEPLIEYIHEGRSNFDLYGVFRDRRFFTENVKKDSTPQKMLI